MLRTFFLIPVVLACFALLPTQNAFALTPAPDDGYNGWNRAKSSGALFSFTTGDLARPLVVMRSTETFPRAQIRWTWAGSDMLTSDNLITAAKVYAANRAKATIFNSTPKPVTLGTGTLYNVMEKKARWLKR